LIGSPGERALHLESFVNVPPFLLLTVEDNGPGVPPELLDKIFQPYFTTKTSGRGTGLGLAIVDRLVREARGVLHVRSIPGEGTVFHLYLPAMTAPARA
jgi:signal transduction histidine kinase